MRAGHDDVELGQQGVFEVEPVLEDVHLDAGEQAERVAVGLELAIDAGDLGDLFRSLASSRPFA
ncbi:MAG: hypothetical protein CM1200mP34_0520 [Verrucomicrobiales bacterium]|nr:MAG: hypothetical protein CM1200mP34_0520 [Verrucomicrobiales bacterium]